MSKVLHIFFLPEKGTSLLMVATLLVIFLFSVVKFDQMMLNLIARIAIILPITGFAYEIIRYAAKEESSQIFRLVTKLGLWLQKITTSEPKDEQLEVAIVASKT